MSVMMCYQSQQQLTDEVNQLKTQLQSSASELEQLRSDKVNLLMLFCVFLLNYLMLFVLFGLLTWPRYSHRSLRHTHVYVCMTAVIILCFTIKILH